MILIAFRVGDITRPPLDLQTVPFSQKMGTSQFEIVVCNFWLLLAGDYVYKNSYVL